MTYPDFVDDLGWESEVNPDHVDKALIFLRDMSFDEHLLLSTITLPTIFFATGL